MILIDTIRDKDNFLRGFTCKGHAGYGDYGQDIVCAGVSALVVNCINSIENYSDSKFSVTEDEDEGLIALCFEGEIDDKADLLVRSMFLGLVELEKSYGSEFIKVNDNH